MKIQYLSSSEIDGLEDRALVVEGVLVVMPFVHTDHAQRAATLMAQRAGAPGSIYCVLDEKQEGFIAIVNRIFTKSQSAYFAYVAQDAFAGRDWLKLGLACLGQSKHFLGFNDGKWAGAIAGFGLARRSWAEKNYATQFFFPKYSRHYADAELTLLALQEQVYAYDPASLLIEVDWAKDGAAVDAQDRALFLKRKQNGFDAKVTSPQLLDLIS